MELKLFLMLASKESTMVYTPIIEKMPMVTPNNDKTVRNKLDFKACQANLKLSNVSFKNSIPEFYIY
jgi:hypothetical protein